MSEPVPNPLLQPTPNGAAERKLQGLPHLCKQYLSLG